MQSFISSLPGGTIAVLNIPSPHCSTQSSGLGLRVLASLCEKSVLSCFHSEDIIKFIKSIS